MKKLKVLKLITIISILFLFSNCSNDNSFNDNEEVSLTEQNESKQLKNTCDNELELIVTYTFDPFTSEEEQLNFIESYRLEMAQYFTICSILEATRNCENVEKWTVNGDEYYDFFTENATGTTTTSNGDAEMKTRLYYEGQCFNYNFPF